MPLIGRKGRRKNLVSQCPLNQILWMPKQLVLRLKLLFGLVDAIMPRIYLFYKTDQVIKIFKSIFFKK